MSRTILGVTGLGVVLTLVGHLPLSWPTTMSAQAAAIGAIAMASALAWTWRRGLHRWLTSVPFAASLLTALLVLTALGTFIVQGLLQAELSQRYGPTWSGAFRLFLLDDIFHATTYRGFLAILVVALMLVTLKRRAWRITEWGFLLTHIGIVVVLVGGLIGSLWGFKGFINIHEGQTATTLVLQGATPKPVPLEFGLRLDRFEIDRYPVEYRLYLYEMEGSGECRVTASHTLKDAAEWTPIGKEGTSFRVVKSFPDFRMQSELRESEGPEARSVAELRVYERDGRSRTVPLFAGASLRLQRPPAEVRFIWNPDDYRPLAEPTTPESHTLTFREREGAEPQDIRVSVGETYRLGSYEVRVMTYLPDFAYDTQKRAGYSRSTQPNNPALQVRIGDKEERWLFSRMPDYGHNKESAGPKLTYRYEPAREPAEREIVVVGRTREVVEYIRGVERGRTALKLSGSEEDPIVDGLSVCCERVLERAEEIHTPISRSKEWRHPAVEIELRTGDRVTSGLISAGPEQALKLTERGPLLVLNRKTDDVRAYRSCVSIVEGDNPVASDTIAVNRPLAWKGYLFYQSSFRAEDPTYSGIIVVKDPGLRTVYVGFVMLSLGVIAMFYVQPRVRRARIAAKGVRP